MVVQLTEIMIVVGTRPEVVKMAPVIWALEEVGQDFVVVHSGQHYDYNLSLQFIEDLGLAKPDYDLEVKEQSPTAQTGRMMIAIGEVVEKEEMGLMLIEGDTNTILAAALAAFKKKVPVGHVEAGLRSYDFRMPEEHNRRMVDHASAYLFAPTNHAKQNLVNENVWGMIYVTGNTVIDAVIQHMPLAEKRSDIMNRVKYSEYALATAHRAENVDDSRVLKSFASAFMEAPIPVVFSVHPRTEKRLRQHRIWNKLRVSDNVQLLPPAGYLDFLVLMKNCEMILTDSGGLQEEATAPPIRKKVLVMRRSTERPEAVEAGFARVVGTEKSNVLAAINEILEERKEIPLGSPYGDGNAGRNIAQIVKNELECMHKESGVRAESNHSEDPVLFKVPGGRLSSGSM
ncbi:MAG: UDP-N-acetylglucosamine 2-epimerase (non-hydrolyzing) [Candidatus Bathyarchaeota archaeon]|nr:MAG: UDP-N-acetylglucosamine 2-epimerase (non-hydrolyzing) [Candidatus Bathyarchaeota archaeon]